MRQEVLAGRLHHAMRERLAGAAHRLGLAQRALHAVSPLATLARGFAVVTRADDGARVTQASHVKAGDELDTHLADGRFRSRVTDVDL